MAAEFSRGLQNGLRNSTSRRRIGARRRRRTSGSGAEGAGLRPALGMSAEKAAKGLIYLHIAPLASFAGDHSERAQARCPQFEIRGSNSVRCGILNEKLIRRLGGSYASGKISEDQRSKIQR